MKWIEIEVPNTSLLQQIEIWDVPDLYMVEPYRHSFISSLAETQIDYAIVVCRSVLATTASSQDLFLKSFKMEKPVLVIDASETYYDEPLGMLSRICQKDEKAQQILEERKHDFLRLFSSGRRRKNLDYLFCLIQTAVHLLETKPDNYETLVEESNLFLFLEKLTNSSSSSSPSSRKRKTEDQLDHSTCVKQQKID